MEFLALSKQQIIKSAGDYDLTVPQAFVLLLTPRDEFRAMHSYCALLGCDASNMTGIADGLEKKGLLERAEHPTDRRVKILRLLPKGAKIREAILELMATNTGSYLASRLNDEEMAQFIRLIQKITAGVCPAEPKPETK